MNFIKVEQLVYDAAGDEQVMHAYLNLDNVIAIYPDANLVTTNADFYSPRELAYMTLTDESFEVVLKAITGAVDILKFDKVLTEEEIDELRKKMGDDVIGV